MSLISALFSTTVNYLELLVFFSREKNPIGAEFELLNPDPKP
jgi:hypothetical protein